MFLLYVMEEKPTNRFSAEMETRISKRTESVCPRYAFASVRAGYCFFKGLRLMAVTVAAKIDRNSLIFNKWAAETRCRVCNGILQRSAVPTGAPVHPNLITYPDSPHFPITGGGEAVCTQTVTVNVGYTTCLAGRSRQYILGWWEGSRALWRVSEILLSVVFHFGAEWFLQRRTARTVFFSSVS